MGESLSSDFQESLDIAIVGMAGRFPGATNIDQFWRNLKNGVESISVFTDTELAAAGIKPELIHDPHYVKAGGVLDDAELFDAAFFGIYPREAEIMDPQHRHFLECAHESLENAGYNPELYRGLIGVFAGTGMSTYLLFNLLANREIRDTVHPYQLTIANDKDFLPTRVSYKMNLKGPSVNVQTACSTSLVAVHMACLSLLNFQCDMALAGGVAILSAQKRGYLYQEGGIASPDGHCRAFDARAGGTINGNGVAIVVLKRLADAIADGDTIHALIKGSAINNDGSVKVGYTAPGVDGQAAVIAAAQAIANVKPETIRYVEAHGTGTALGDPIEIAALTQVFRADTQAKHFCAVGSVKTNVGHLDAAAGVTGLLKAVLALEHRFIPPSLHYETPNPKIDFANSPFFVNAKPTEWEPLPGGIPRRAAVSSFGIGGTNAHAVLEEAPVPADTQSTRTWQLILLSARTDNALERVTERWRDHLKENPHLSLADVAFTSQVGRRAFARRRFLVARDSGDAAAALASMDPRRVLTGSDDAADPGIVFMFTGQGAQRVGMASEIYRTEPTFRRDVDECSELLRPHIGLDLRRLLYAPADKVEDAAHQLEQTWITQPALFVVEHAMARLWMEWGIQPAAMIGHSIGEYVAACLAGVFSVEDALALVAARGRLMQGMPAGAMLSVPLSEQEILAQLPSDLALAAVNAPSLCVVSGSCDSIGEFERHLNGRGVDCYRLHTSHAFHSAMMDPILAAFATRIASIKLLPPRIPFVSNVTGSWITPEDATDPSYWSMHLRRTVRFADGVGKLMKDQARVLLEVGPGTTLRRLAQLHPDTEDRLVFSSLPDPRDRVSDDAFLLSTLGRLWSAGARVEWEGFHAHERLRRVPLPAYPFERQRFWVEPDCETPGLGDSGSHSSLGKKPNIAEWLYVPSWKRAEHGRTLSNGLLSNQTRRWLICSDGVLGNLLADRLKRQKQEVFTVRAANDFERSPGRNFSLNPHQNEDQYCALIETLDSMKAMPDTIVHCWTAKQADGDAGLEERLDLGYYSLLALARALSRKNLPAPVQLVLVTSGAEEVTGDEELCPENALTLGLLRVIAQEHPDIRCRSIDIPPVESDQSPGDVMIERILAEAADGNQAEVAFRGGYRWIQAFAPIPAVSTGQAASRLRPGGAYFITGGLGRIGLVFAEYLARSVQAKLMLVDREPLPDRSVWPDWLASHTENDRCARKIRKIQVLEALGSEILVAQADVASYDDMRRALDVAQRTFGAIHGIIHAAGLVGDAAIKSIRETSRVESEAHFDSKVRGLIVLERIAGQSKLDFCLLQSSLSAILGGLGLGAYAAANRFMDAFVHKRRQSGDPAWLTVNWDGWRN
jgi:acyl transferase domain-containing protein